MSTIKKAGVLGWPIAHSRSPLIHNYWLRLYGVEGDYSCLPVAPEALADFFCTMVENGFCGANVTTPHKEAAFHACDYVSDTAKIVGAVNTLWLDQGRLQGDNSDIFGFLANLDEEVPGWDVNADSAVVIGAGGAARAIIVALSRRGFQRLRIINRSLSRAETLAIEFSPLFPSAVQAVAWDGAEAALAEAALVVNTTTLGMSGQPPLNLRLDALPTEAVVSDIIYTPLETNWLKYSRSQGHRVSTGLGMLLHQARMGFRIWFGIDPEVTPALRGLLEADVVRAQS